MDAGVDGRAAADLCRVTVVGPQGRFDIVLPAAVPLAYLVPTLLEHAGAGLAESGVAEGGWVLQRLGGVPLDAGRTASAQGLSDGEVLYFRPAAAAAPPLVHDDTAEAVGAVLAQRTAAWTPATARTAALAAVGVLAAAGALILLFAGPGWRAPSLAAAGTALVLLAAAALVSRAADDAVAATVLGCAAAGYAFLATVLAFVPGRSGVVHAGGAGVASGAAVALAVAALAAAAVGRGAAVFGAVGLLALAGMAGGAAASATSPAGGAAAAVAVAFLVAPFAPMAAYRSARLPAPFLPTTAEELRSGGAVPDGAILAARTLDADLFLSSLTAGSALATGGAAAVLLVTAPWTGPALAGVAGLLALLRSRHYGGRAQKLWLIAVGTLVVGATAAVSGIRLAAEHGAVAAVPAALAVSAAAAVTAVLSGRARAVSPPARRLLDLVEIACAVATVPLILAALGVYAHLRTMFG